VRLTGNERKQTESENLEEALKQKGVKRTVIKQGLLVLKMV